MHRLEAHPTLSMMVLSKKIELSNSTTGRIQRREHPKGEETPTPPPHSHSLRNPYQ